MKVDFYLLESAQGAKAWHFACRLVEKIYLSQQTAYIHTNTAKEAEQLDQLLWIFRDDSFIPHQLCDEMGAHPAPIQIGHPGNTPPKQAILLNLSKEVPDFYRQFDRVMETVFHDPIVQQAARGRYRQYRDHGCELNTIKIPSTQLS